MSENTLILKGNIIFSKNPDQFTEYPNGYLVVQDGKITDCFSSLPESFQKMPLIDYQNCLIIPGLVDLHLHAPQYPICGINMDLELIPWLNQYAFVEESKYIESAYFTKAYAKFVSDLQKSATTRAVIFATIHTEATKYLMDELEKSGLSAMVGKVNMDRNSSEALTEDTATSLEKTERWILDTKNRYQNVSPIITPRFVPSCSGQLMRGLGELAEKYHLPVQSHLSENQSEIEWVQELHPDSSCYGDVYHKYGLFGNPPKTVMAHCVHCPDIELKLMKENGVYIAHCPQSNINLRSGIAPIHRYLESGIPIGLGSDLAGGAVMSMFRAVTDAIQVSKLRWAMTTRDFSPVTMTQSFYMATKGGGSFFGKVGSFEKDYEMDALILDDSSTGFSENLTTAQRLERIMYLGDDRNIVQKFVGGKPLFPESR